MLRICVVNTFSSRLSRMDVLDSFLISAWGSCLLKSFLASLLYMFISKRKGGGRSKSLHLCVSRPLTPRIRPTVSQLRICKLRWRGPGVICLTGDKPWDLRRPAKNTWVDLAAPGCPAHSRAADSWSKSTAIASFPRLGCQPCKEVEGKTCTSYGDEFGKCGKWLATHLFKLSRHLIFKFLRFARWIGNWCDLLCVYVCSCCICIN